MSADAAGIAAKLTKARRELVLALDGEEYRDWGARGMPGNRTTRESIALLTDEGWCANWWRRLTPLGLAVRAILANQGPPRYCPICTHPVSPADAVPVSIGGRAWVEHRDVPSGARAVEGR